MSARYLARYLLCLGLYYSGIVFLARAARLWRGRYRLVVLAYHSFSDGISYLDMAVPPSLFREQLRYLCRAFKVRSLSSVLAAWQGKSGVQGDTAVITVDDGYADNFQPLMDGAVTFGAPSTLYLTTGCIDARRPTTVMSVMLAVHHAAVKSIDLSEFGLGAMPIQTPAEKESAIRAIDGYLKPQSPDRREEVIGALMEKTGNRDMIRELARSAMLNWDQVRVMRAAGVEFGAHTVTHPVLSGLDSLAARDEICASVQRVKEMLKSEAVDFAYPYGSRSEVDDTAVEICRNSGARSAVMLVEGNMRDGDLFRIPRTMVTSDRSTAPWGSYSRAVWACELEGLVDIARNLVLPAAKRPTGAGRPREIRE
jgi:peptidoglycan/xylan/chitin deacetylase (PgdA/CDA1 family)